MADALFEMDGAPRTDDYFVERLDFDQLGWGINDEDPGDPESFFAEGRPLGYLPLPKDASSPAVAETLGS